MKVNILQNIEDRKKLWFNSAQRKYILRIEQYHLEKENEYLKKIHELQSALSNVGALIKHE